MASSRQYDLVLFGATGYTGKLTAEYIVNYFPTDLTWAIAGRSHDKLSATATTLQNLNSDRKGPAIEVAQLNDSDMSTLAKQTRCIINTVGPYCIYGEPVIKACAENGTHYLDVTGESPFVRDMVKKYHEKARATGAIIIPEVGLESAPMDMMTYALASYLKKQLGASTKEVIVSVHDMQMSVSGGTLATVQSVFEVYSLLDLMKSGFPSAVCPIAISKQSPASSVQRLLGLRVVSDLGTMTTSPQAASDVPIVYRSWGLLTQAGQTYGPNFNFSVHLAVRNAFLGVLVHWATAVAPLLLALSPVRWLLKQVVYAPGQGPTKEETKNHHAEWRAVAIPDGLARQKGFARFRYEGSAYELTAITVSEAARTILKSEDTVAKKLGGGILTGATLGDAYLENLAKAGLNIEMKMMDI